MRQVTPAPAALVVAVRAGLVVSLLMLVLGLSGFAMGPAAADGPQASPTLLPFRVESPTDAFSLIPPADARCEEDGSGSGPDTEPGARSGSDNWRWHTFIVEAGRDLSTLRFGPFGPGDDYDASDGPITAGLIASGTGVWEEPPAQQPKGLVNPNELGGLVLDPATYTLRDGDYEIGFACTDATVATRQWWSLIVTVRTSGAPFLTVASQGDAPTGSTPTSTSAADATPGGGDGSSTTSSTETAAAAGSSETSAPAAESIASAATTRNGVASPTGISWAPLVALRDVSGLVSVWVWAALVVAFARASYLLAIPVRIRPSLAP